MPYSEDQYDMMRGDGRILIPQPRNEVGEIRISSDDFDVDLWRAGQDWMMSVWDRDRGRLRVCNLGIEPREVYMTALKLMKQLGSRLLDKDRIKINERNRLHELVSCRWEDGVRKRKTLTASY